MAKPDFTKQLTEFLQQQAPEQVVQWLVQAIDMDSKLKKQWQVQLLLNSGKPSDYKKFLTQALPKKNLQVSPNLWRKVALYFSDAEGLFTLALEQVYDSLNNEQQFVWLMQAFERINQVLGTIDDSGGYRLELVDQLSAQRIHCFHQLDWSVEQKVSWLHEYQYKYDVFPYIPEQFELPAELEAAFINQSSEQLKSHTPDNVSMALLDRLKKDKKP